MSVNLFPWGFTSRNGMDNEKNAAFFVQGQVDKNINYDG